MANVNSTREESDGLVPLGLVPTATSLVSSTVFLASTGSEATITAPCSGVVDVDEAQYLHQHNMDRMSNLTPYLLYLVTLMVFGMVGNSIVLMVYYYKFKPSNPRTFVLAMSLCDLMTNVWALVTETVELRYAFTFYSGWACKLFKTVMNVVLLFSGLVLVAVATERRKMVCGHYTSGQSMDKMVRVALIVCGALSVGFSLPRIALYGTSTYVFPGTNITGVLCNIQDAHRYSFFPAIYNGLLALVFVLTVLTMVGCYGRIGVHLWRHKKQMVESNMKEITSMSSTSDNPSHHQNNRKKSNTDTSDAETNTSLDQKDAAAAAAARLNRDPQSIQLVQIVNQTSATTPQSLSQEPPAQDPEAFRRRAESSAEKPKEATKPKVSITPTEAMKIRSLVRTLSRQTSTSSGKPIPSRTTLMLFVLTVLFIINFLPYLVMEIMYSLAPRSPLWDMDHNVLLLLFRSYYLNSAINPLVYSFCSAKFRHECCQLAKNLRQRWARGKAIV